ncbi:MAG: carboxypeptidase regulatory-like domain-containing protein [Coriobacteriia bacterium]
MTHSRKVLACLLALALVISATISPAYAARPTSTTGGTLTGKATVAGTRTAVEGATVTAVGSDGTRSTTTGSRGTYSITGLPAGPYTVTCAATGYQTLQLSATVRDGSKTTLNFALVPAVATTGSLAGTVTGPDGVIPGAVVRTLTGGYSALTDGDGSYRIDNMAAGTYDVLASAAGYADLTKQVSITAGVTAALDFALSDSTLEITSLVANPSTFIEGMESTVTLSASFSGSPASYAWSQVSGPKGPITSTDAASALVDVSAIEVAAETSMVFSLTLTDDAGISTSTTVGVDVTPADIVPILGPNVQVGGSTYAATHADIGGVEWAFFNVGAAFKATPVGTTAGAVTTLNLAGIVYDIDIVERDGATYALVACGNAGIAVVDVSDPSVLALVSITPVNYYQDGIIFCDTGGTIWYDNVIQSGTAPICALETDGTDLYIADNDFGFHKTALANLFGTTGPVLEVDGTLLIDAEKYTLQWAGEKAWGGPISLKLRGDRLFVSMGALGLGIFDTASLKQVGGYNLYTDPERTEDYFGSMVLSEDTIHSDDVTGDLYLDDFTGMPDYRQVQFEVYEINKGNLTGVPTPWADFEREGQWYYGAADVDVAQYAERTIAYIAYSLGGIVAVDVTACESASADSFVTAPYLGYFPAVPVNGPYDTGSNPSSLLPYEGAGMLKESGVTAVRVSGEKVLATDHFAGLMVLDGASAPDTWQGSAPPYNNDTNGIADDEVPDFEDITSYNMAPWDETDNESLPVAFYEWPCQLATRELMGHGYGLSLFEPLSLEAAGNVDVLECSSAGGFVFVDVKSLSAPLMEDRFEILGYFPTTSEIGADVNGDPTQTMAVGHASGISASNNYLYLSDGPHGISAWNITDALGFMTDEIHVVGNTVQDEYPQLADDGTWVYPPSHTVRNVVDLARGVTWAMCVGNGMRRTPIAEIEAGLGTAGAPILMALGRSDSFEHNADEFSLKVFPYQDSAYDVAFRGDYAYVADGARGVTIYDVSKDPAIKNSGFFVANVGWNKGMPQLGTCSGIELWQDPATSRVYAVLACGPYGVGVVDVTDPMAMRIVKVFEPIKIEDDDIAVADGQAIDVQVVGDKAYYAYDSFGVLCYAMSDLVAPLPDGVSPTNLFLKNTLGTVVYDYRPAALGNFKLQLVPGYEDVDGGAVRMEYTEQAGKLSIYAAFGHAGLVKIDYTDPAAPVLVQRIDTNVECVDVVISGGRIYCADGPGGMVFFK